MKHDALASYAKFYATQRICTCMIQAPLPNFLDTLPILVTIEGQGSVLAGCAPLAPPEEPAHD